MLQIYIASDHAGLELKAEIIRSLLEQVKAKSLQIQDLGPFDSSSVDYPDYADLVSKKMKGLSLLSSGDSSEQKLREMGILICGSGQGMCMRANRHPHLRAALCWSVEVARLARGHNNANVLCLGSRVLDVKKALEIVNAFIDTPFEGGRHQNRVLKLGRAT